MFADYGHVSGLLIRCTVRLGAVKPMKKMIVSCGFPISEVSVLKGLMWSFPVVMRGAST